eukprot:TRINITY_DN3663_c0_g1_i1.p1 TRINITY_DN3663_c0_g1~~TRINITY_DN3663_c0_g1_i1.p1  ORF type:complete len:1261 (-),score=167.05 TRINITY_DN3663_c0_g1_i1:136-3918(-)
MGLRTQLARLRELAAPTDDGPEVLHSLRLYAILVAQFPGLALFIYSMIYMCLVWVFMKPLIFDMDFRSFTKTDGLASLHKNGLEAAERALRVQPSDMNLGVYHDKNTTSTTTTTTTTTTVDATTTLATVKTRETRVYLWYVAKDGNALSPEVFAESRAYEQQLLQQPFWSDMCQAAPETHRYKCERGDSLFTKKWPTLLPGGAGQQYVFRFDGKGFELPDKFTTALLEASGDFGRYFPRTFRPGIYEDEVDDSPMAPEALQSILTMVQGYSSSRGQEASAAFEDMCANDLYPYIQATRHKLKGSTLVYHGGCLRSADVAQTISDDILWVTVALAVVFSYTLSHTRSLSLSFFAVMLILMSQPLAYVSSPAQKTSLTSFFGLFMMLGIGADNVFVFFDFWEKSATLTSRVDIRLAWVLEHAVTSCTVTSMTTSVSFFANLTSGLRPLREFGYFLGMSVMCCLALLSLLLPPFFVLMLRFRCCLRGTCTRASPSEGLSLSSVSPTQGADVAGVPTESSTKPPEEQSQKRKVGCRQRFLLFLLKGIFHCPCYVLCTALIIQLVFCACLPGLIELNLEAPAIFPDDHNFQNVGKMWSLFQHRSPSKLAGAVCDALSWKGQNCLVHTCEQLVDEGHNPRCWRSATVRRNYTLQVEQTPWGTLGCQEVALRTRVAASSEAAVQGIDAFWRGVLEDATHLHADDGEETTISALQAPLAFERWETGDVSFSRFYDTGRLKVSDDRVLDNVTCEIEAVCFLGQSACHVPKDWQELSVNTNLLPHRVLSGITDRAVDSPALPRRLAGSARIRVAWGIRVPSSVPMLGEATQFFHLDPTFEPADPWAQRSILALCNDVPKNFNARASACWPQAFQDWLLQFHLRFPSRVFHHQIKEWLSDIGRTQLRFETDREVYTWVDFDVTYEGELASFERKWSDYISAWNAAAPTSVSHAVYSSQTFVNAETIKTMIGGTVETVMIAALGAFFSVIAFTLGNVILSAIVFMLVMMVTISLLFFMVAVGWRLGPIELLSLIIFVGYSTTFALHVVHGYGEAKDQELERLEAHYVAFVSDRERRKKSKGKAAQQRDQSYGIDDGLMKDSGSENSSQKPGQKAEREGLGSPLADRPAALLVCLDEAVTDRQEKSEEQTSQTSARTERRVQRQAVTLARIHRSVDRLGGAVLSSALSTAGSALVLLFCTMTFYPTLGTVLLAVTAFSVIAALVVLPACLAVVKVEPEPCCGLYRLLADIVRKQIARCRQTSGAGQKESAAPP